MPALFDPALTYPNPAVKPYTPYRPNHYSNDSAGDPLTCTDNHNHPGDILTDPDTNAQYQPVLRDGSVGSWEPMPAPMPHPNATKEGHVNHDGETAIAIDEGPIKSQLERIDALFNRVSYSVDRLITKIDPVLDQGTQPGSDVSGLLSSGDDSAVLEHLTGYVRRLEALETDLDRTASRVQL